MGCTRPRTHPVIVGSTSTWGTSRAANRHTRMLQRAAPLVRQPATRTLPAAANRKQIPTTDRSSWASTGSSRGLKVRGTTHPSLRVLLLTIPLAFAALPFHVHTIDCNLAPWVVVCTRAPHTSATVSCLPIASCHTQHDHIRHTHISISGLVRLRTDHSSSSLATGGDSVPDLTANHTNSATLISAAAREFISRVATPNATTPWFLYLPFQNVHAPCKQSPNSPFFLLLRIAVVSHSCIRMTV